MDKVNLNVAVLGSVDSGKSTIIGHMIYKMGGIDKHTMEKQERESTDMGKHSFKYAMVLDNFKNNNTNGNGGDNQFGNNISIWRFETTKNQTITLIDSPGNRDYIENMNNNVSKSQCVLLIVSSSNGEFEAGISKTGQTREHVNLAFSLGVRQLIIAVNKMDDKFTNFSKDRFDEIVKELGIIIKRIGYDMELVTFIPISGWFGDNMLEKSSNMKWYNGLTLLDAFYSLKK